MDTTMFSSGAMSVYGAQWMTMLTTLAMAVISITTFVLCGLYVVAGILKRVR